MPTRLLRRSVSIVLAMMAMPALASSIIHVSTTGNDINGGLSWASAKLTIQRGLNTAVSGDQVWVAAGTYVERITLKSGVALYGGFAGNEAQLNQRNWQANATVVDGNRSGSVVTVPYGASASTQIDGFTIRNGTGTLRNGWLCGGGIYCLSSPMISNNVITANTADGFGGCGAGIYCYSCSPVISGNSITNNIAYGNSGGICCDASSCPQISDNTISGNDGGYAGGIGCYYNSAPTIVGNMITANRATSSGGAYAGGIFCHWSSPLISRNIISGNSSTALGGGIECYCSNAVIANNLITGNWAFNGAAIYCISESPTICNNTIAENTASYTGGIYCRSCDPAIFNNIIAFNSSGVESTVDEMPVLRNNCIYNPGGTNYTGLSAGQGDISADPGFVDRQSSDYRLRSQSPCIDAGYNAGVPSGTIVDLKGNPRFFDAPGIADCRWSPGNCGPAPVVDIGAREYSPGLPGDMDYDDDVDANDLLLFTACGSGPAIRYLGDCFDADIDQDMDVDTNDFAVLQRSLGTVRRDTSAPPLGRGWSP